VSFIDWRRPRGVEALVTRIPLAHPLAAPTDAAAQHPDVGREIEQPHCALGRK
jgi:hypothetical protein